jgi:uncharacterized SAM-binding protein YcdF (DUF218 family)
MLNGMQRLIVWLFLSLMVIVALAYMGRRPLLAGVGRFLIVQDALQPADAIVVLSGSVPDRILEAVDLYQAGLAPRIILTQEGLPPGLAALRARGGNMLERHQQNIEIAGQLGVPEEAITVVTTPAWSTLTEAEAIVDHLRTQGFTSILLVTSKPHARRSALTYRDLVGDGIRIIVAPSRYDNFAPDRWWEHRPPARRLLIEYLKLLNYVAVDRWRERSPRPGSP